MLNTNNVRGFESIKLINSKRQRPNLKKLLTKAEFSNEEVGVKKVPGLAMRLLQVINTISMQTCSIYHR